MAQKLEEALNKGSGVAFRGKVGTLLENLVNVSKNYVMSEAGAGLDLEAANPEDIETNATLGYAADGEIPAAKAATASIVLTGSTIPDGQFAIWLVEIGTAGTFRTRQGTISDTLAEAIAAPPASATDHCVLGLVTVGTIGATFIPGTTELTAAEVTDTYTDLCCYPIDSPSTIEAV